MSRRRLQRKLILAAASFALVVAAGSLSATSARPASADATVTSITVNGSGGDKTFLGVGAVLGGGGNARYLEDYPDAQRQQILNYLFDPGYGASLQVLKLEIGGGTNSTDGSEPSIEPVMVPPNPANPAARFCPPGQPGFGTAAAPCINCYAGYELSIAQQAVNLNPNLVLYGLQWTAPSWVTGTSAEGTTTLFTNNDIQYVVDWLTCAQRLNLTVSYIGGWNENAGGDTSGATTYDWYKALRTALDNAGFSSVSIIAGDLNPEWQYASNTVPNPYPDIDDLGAHDVCGYPNEQLTNGDAPVCKPPEDSSDNAINPPQPLWASELGAMDAGAQTGCTEPCAPAMDRSLVRGYLQAKLVGYLEWPVIDAMPVLGSTEDSTPLPYENRGLVTADQPWSGNYTVNAMTWAIAQVTDFTAPPTSLSRWLYQDTGTGLLPNNGGSYVTLIHQTYNTTTDTWQGDGYTTVVETTTASASQQVQFSISGGSGVSGGVASEPVHIWSSNFDFNSQYDEPQYWLWHRGDTDATTLEQQGYTLQPGFVYTFTTSDPTNLASNGQVPGSASATPAPPAPPASGSLTLPYSDSLATSGAAGSLDDEPQYLDAQDGSFEIVPCATTPPGGYATCTGQATPLDASGDQPVFWHPAQSGVRYPYAIIGDGSWYNYTESVNMLLPQNPASSASGGLIGYYTLRSDSNNPGLFDGFVFDLSTAGTWQLINNSASSGGQVVLDSGTFTNWPSGTSSTGWNTLSLSFSNDGANCASPEPSSGVETTITASIDHDTVGSSTVCTTGGGLGGIEAGYTNSTTDNWPAVQYSDLNVTSP
jgi:hypothetical protein